MNLPDNRTDLFSSFPREPRPPPSTRRGTQNRVCSQRSLPWYRRRTRSLARSDKFWIKNTTMIRQILFHVCIVWIFVKFIRKFQIDSPDRAWACLPSTWLYRVICQKQFHESSCWQAPNCGVRLWEFKFKNKYINNKNTELDSWRSWTGRVLVAETGSPDCWTIIIFRAITSHRFNAPLRMASTSIFVPLTFSPNSSGPVDSTRNALLSKFIRL